MHRPWYGPGGFQDSRRPTVLCAVFVGRPGDLRSSTMQQSSLRDLLRPRTRVRAFAGRRRAAAMAARYAQWREQPLDENAVLYESFFGNGMLDHPEAIFRYLLDQ